VSGDADADRRTEAVIRTLLAVRDCIRELGSVPSGELYARLCGHMSLETYESIIQTMINARVVRRSNHLLTWIGPPEIRAVPTTKP
jgi:hypothetical protein